MKRENHRTILSEKYGMKKNIHTFRTKTLIRLERWGFW